MLVASGQVCIPKVRELTWKTSKGHKFPNNDWQRLWFYYVNCGKEIENVHSHLPRQSQLMSIIIFSDSNDGNRLRAAEAGVRNPIFWKGTSLAHSHAQGYRFGGVCHLVIPELGRSTQILIHYSQAATLPIDLPVEWLDEVCHSAETIRLPCLQCLPRIEWAVQI